MRGFAATLAGVDRRELRRLVAVHGIRFARHLQHVHGGVDVCPTASPTNSRPPC